MRRLFFSALNRDEAMSDHLLYADAYSSDRRRQSRGGSYCGGIVWCMPRGNPSPKLAITVDPDVHARVVAAAAADGVSVSAWMTAAARRALLLRDGLAAVAEWEAEQGPLTTQELADARQRLNADRAERRPA